MTNTPTSDNTKNPNDQEYDDLTVIKGIGEKTQDWLRASFSVHTFSDLTALSVDDVESTVKAEGRAISQSEIRKWIAQARNLTAIRDRASKKGAASADTGTEKQSNSQSNQGEWKQLAQFVVVFEAFEINGEVEEQRTTVHHMEAGEGETWPGIEKTQLGQWMLDRLGTEAQEWPIEKPTVEAEEPSVEAAKPSIEAEEPAVELAEPVVGAEGQRVEAPPPAPSPVALAITQVRVFQPPASERSHTIGSRGESSVRSLTSGEPFAIEAAFELTGPGAAETARKRAHYSVQFYAHNRSTAARSQLIGTIPGASAQDKLSYTVLLSKAALPPGIYRLQVVATLKGTPARAGYLEVPLLQVA